MIRKVFHLVAILHFFGGFWYDVQFVDIPFLKHRLDFKLFGGRLKFLTIWNVLLQGLFFTICLLNDLVGNNEDFPKKTPLIRRIKDGLLPCLAFPLSMFVGLTFWALYLVDRELIFPKALDEFFPVWLNHLMHTNIMVFILLELFTSFRQYPRRKVGITVLTIFMATYLVWIHIIHSYSGIWVYPVLDVLNLPLRIVFFAVLLALIMGLYILGEKLNNLIWSRNLTATNKKSMKKKH